MLNLVTIPEQSAIHSLYRLLDPPVFKLQLLNIVPPDIFLDAAFPDSSSIPIDLDIRPIAKEALPMLILLRCPCVVIVDHRLLVAPEIPSPGNRRPRLRQIVEQPSEQSCLASSMSHGTHLSI